MMKKIITLNILILISLVGFSQTDIATARTQPIGTTVEISGIVTSGNELGDKIRYIEDLSAGIALYELTSNNYFNNVIKGDSITVKGELADFNGLLEVYLDTNPIINSSLNALPVPQLITPLQIGETTEGELIQINNVIFANGGGVFSSGATEDFISNGEQGTIYLQYQSSIIGKLIPMGPVNLIGISSQYINPGAPSLPGYQILPRDSSDIMQTGSLVFTSGVTQSNITNNGFDLSWNVSANSSTNCNYGTTTSLGTSVNNGGSTLTHSITLTGLSPATFYYVECYSVTGIDTAFSSTGLYSTASNSSGIIRPYFNHSVDITVSTGVNAQDITTYFNDTIKAYIDKAQNTLDVCIYNASDATITNAINDAYSRGVQVRCIANSNSVSMLNNLDPNIAVNVRASGLAGFMHNKFIIVDASSTNNSWVMGGSCNWTNPSNLFNDFNNIIFIQDKAIAKVYELEFEEMWNGDFGIHKKDNTPHKFKVGGRDIEVYFSPSDQTTSKIIEVINDVNHTFEFGLLSFTRGDIADAVIYKDKLFGVNVRGIIEDANGLGSQFHNLDTSGVNVKSHTGVTGQFHHKYAIADANEIGSDPTILTGSHNWSNNAENNSDENTMIIHDHTIANIYLQEFTKRFNELSNTYIEELIDVEVLVFPNPTTATVNIKSNLNIKQIKVYQIDGKLLHSTTNTSVNINTKGIYLLKIITNKGNVIKRVIVE